MRHCFALSCVVAMAAMAPAAFAQAPMTVDTDDRCAHVEPEPAIAFRGRQLESSPDIKEHELRVIDAMISTKGCFDAAAERLVQYTRSNPDDYHAAFAEARITWLSGNPQQATENLQ